MAGAMAEGFSALILLSQGLSTSWPLETLVLEALLSKFNENEATVGNTYALGVGRRERYVPTPWAWDSYLKPWAREYSPGSSNSSVGCGQRAPRLAVGRWAVCTSHPHWCKWTLWISDNVTGKGAAMQEGKFKATAAKWDCTPGLLALRFHLPFPGTPGALDYRSSRL